MSRATTAWVCFVIALAMPWLNHAATHWHPAEVGKTISYLVIAVVTAGLKVTLPGIDGTMTAGFFMCLLALVDLSLPEAIALGVASTLAQTIWNARNKPQPLKIGFNLAVIVIAVGCGHYLINTTLPAISVDNLLARLLIGATVYFCLNAFLISVAMSLSEGKPLTKVLVEYGWWGYPFYLVGAAIAGIARSLNTAIGWETTVMGFPVIMVLQRSYQFYLEKLRMEKQHVQDMAALHLRTIEALALAIDAKDDTTQDHLHRVQVYAVEIGKELKLDDDQIEAIRAAAILHDIGKLAVPEHILAKPGKLNPQEFQKIMIHPIVGAEILEQVEFPYPVVPIVRSHHERWDGAGYPDGLAGEEIPIGARILCVVDALDALTSDRPFRPCLPLDQAMAKIRADAGTAFDPKVVEILERRYSDLELESKNTVSQRKKLTKDVRLDRRVAPAAGLEDGPSPAPAVQETTGDFVSSIAAARQEVQLMLEVTSDLGSSLSLNETLSVVASRLGKLIPYDAIAIFVNRNQVLKAEFVAGADMRLLSSLEIPWGEGLSGWAAAHDRWILNGNPTVETGYTNDPTAFSVLRSALSAPIAGEKSVAGVVTLYRMEKEAFTEDNLRVLTAVNGKLGTAISNALKFQQAESSATIDALTGLPNARALFAHLDKQISGARSSNQSLTLLVCDLDGFKAVNDKFGHLEGNRVLQIVGAGFKNSIRDLDYVARMGGDEFVFVLPNIGDDAAKLVSRLEAIARQAGRDVTGTDMLCVSAGPAEFPSDGTNAEDLLAVADKRMYKAKAVNKKKWGIPTRAEMAAQQASEAEITAAH